MGEFKLFLYTMYIIHIFNLPTWLMLCLTQRDSQSRSNQRWLMLILTPVTRNRVESGWWLMPYLTPTSSHFLINFPQQLETLVIQRQPSSSSPVSRRNIQYPYFPILIHIILSKMEFIYSVYISAKLLAVLNHCGPHERLVICSLDIFATCELVSMAT